MNCTPPVSFLLPDPPNPPESATADEAVALLRAALQRIADLKPEPYAMPPDWHEQIAACAECKRWEGHPIQLGICDEHRRPLWARKDHEAFEQKALGVRAALIAQQALRDARSKVSDGDPPSAHSPFQERCCEGWPHLAGECIR